MLIENNTFFLKITFIGIGMEGEGEEEKEFKER